MKCVVSDRGFRFVLHPSHADGRETRLVSESSVIRYPDAEPGSSCLWIGADHHLDREEVAELVARMRRWLKTGRLPK